MKVLVSIVTGLLMVGCATPAERYLIIQLFSPVGLFVVALISSVWVAADSADIKFVEYKSAISTGPVMLGLGCLALWIVVFPWYLYQRGKILKGTAELKEPE